MNGIEPDVGAAEVELARVTSPGGTSAHGSRRRKRRSSSVRSRCPSRTAGAVSSGQSRSAFRPRSRTLPTPCDRSSGPGGSGEPNVFVLVITRRRRRCASSARRAGPRTTHRSRSRLRAPRMPCAPPRPRSPPIRRSSAPLHGTVRRGGEGGRMRLSPTPAAIVLAVHRQPRRCSPTDLASSLSIAAALLAVILRFGQPGRRRLYVVGALWSGLGVLLVSPFLAVVGTTRPLVRPDRAGARTTRRHPRGARARPALRALRLVAVALAFAAYALLVDHDRLLASLGFARRSAFAAVLATRLVPTLERDARGLAEAVRGRGIAVDGVRAHAATRLAARGRLARAGAQPGRRRWRRVASDVRAGRGLLGTAGHGSTGRRSPARRSSSSEASLWL